MIILEYIYPAILSVGIYTKNLHRWFAKNRGKRIKK